MTFLMNYKELEPHAEQGEGERQGRQMGGRGILVLYQESCTLVQNGRGGSGLRGAKPGIRGPKKVAGPGAL